MAYTLPMLIFCAMTGSVAFSSSSRIASYWSLESCHSTIGSPVSVCALVVESDAPEAYLADLSNGSAISLPSIGVLYSFRLALEPTAIAPTFCA